MFEGISMISIDAAMPIVNTNFRKKLTKLADISPEGMDAFKGSFTLSGKRIQALMPLPSISETTGNFAFVQTFVVIDADKNYSTLREGYDSYLLLYTYDGEGTLEYEGQTYTLHPGEGFFIDCRKPHFYHTSGQHWYHGDLHFAGGNADLLYQEFRRDSSPVFCSISDSQYHSYLMNILKTYSVLSPHRECYVASAISSLICYITKENEKQANTIPEVYQCLIKYLECNYDHELSLDELARFSGISKYHLSREFKKHTGYSPIDYIIELRITHAKFLLANTDIPAYKIGDMVGVPNETNFMRLFKKKTGEPPGHYRDKVRSVN